VTSKLTIGQVRLSYIRRQTVPEPRFYRQNRFVHSWMTIWRWSLCSGRAAVVTGLL